MEVGFVDDALIASLPGELHGRWEHIRDTMKRS